MAFLRTTRLMAVRDFVNDDYVLHYVNWNLAVPQVQEMVGTNHTGNAEPLELYAYITQAEIPTSVDFAYRLQEIINGFLLPQLLMVILGISLMKISTLNISVNTLPAGIIVDLVGGAYEVRVSSHYPVDTSHSIAVINIYNGTIVPQPNVNGLDLLTTVQRGETYTITSPSFTGSEEYLQSVIYKYRYVNVNNSVVSPVSQWMYFGDVNGNANDNWIPEPYIFEWTVYPYYLFNNTIQVVAFADIWGTRHLSIQ